MSFAGYLMRGSWSLCDNPDREGSVPRPRAGPVNSGPVQLRELDVRDAGRASDCADPASSDDKQCPECGAVSLVGLSCLEMLTYILGWEGADPGLPSLLFFTSLVSTCSTPRPLPVKHSPD